MADLFRTLIIAATDAPVARTIAAAFGPGGVGMWTTPLSASGNEPTTHYISSGYVPDQFSGLAPYGTWEANEAGEWERKDYYPGDAASVSLYAAEGGVTLPQSVVEGIFSRADVSTQDPHVVMKRLSLKIVSPKI